MTFEELALSPVFFAAFLFLGYKRKKELSKRIYIINLIFLSLCSIAYFILRLDERNVGYVLLLYGAMPLGQMVFLKKGP